MLSIGLMSGTSMDGIDAALIDTDGEAEINDRLGQLHIPYHPCFTILLKATEWAIRKNKGDLEKASLNYQQSLYDYLEDELHLLPLALNDKIEELNAYLFAHSDSNQKINLAMVIKHSTDLHGQAVQALLQSTRYQAQQIDVVGYHGQTMFHQPLINKSIIIGDGQALANQIGITVVNDFRRLDMAAGGQGAPLAPLYHQALAKRDKKIPAAIINCGGIANITLVNSEADSDLIAFDTGPGNGLLDRLVRHRTHGTEHMDKNGHYGLKGHVHDEVLKALFAKSILRAGENYFALPPPKSLDIGELTLIPELAMLTLEDACATLEAFTAASIVTSVIQLNIDLPRYWVLVGGGWHNPVIYNELKCRLIEKCGIDTSIVKADEMGWNSQAMEAQIFAYLAVRSLQKKPLSLPGTTGVSKPHSGGQAFLPNRLATQ
ncbi:MAG: anhydro-N-acetylmuramic acid kinase [Gammaproteobacteria bacterium]|nr:anhydro-N-acetylmuramic acid kinase [Gammaproteobacteria bacterium]